jgi:hypothetical protein
METAHDGRQVVGMDLHRRRSVLVRMTEEGRRLGTARIANSPAELRREIARAGKSPRVLLEAAYGWCWAADTLAAASTEVHLVHLVHLVHSLGVGEGVHLQASQERLSRCGGSG